MLDFFAEFYLRKCRRHLRWGARVCLHTPLGFFRGKLYNVGIRYVVVKLDMKGLILRGILKELVVPEDDRLAYWLIRRKITRIHCGRKRDYGKQQPESDEGKDTTAEQ